MQTINTEGQVVVEIEGENLTLTKDMLDVRINAKEGFDVQMQDNLFIILNTELTQELLDEGYAREIISKVQQLRKNNEYEVMDRINLTISCDEEVTNAVKAYEEYIKTETLTDTLTFAENDGAEVDLNGHSAVIKTERV